MDHALAAHWTVATLLTLAIAGCGGGSDGGGADQEPPNEPTNEPQRIDTAGQEPDFPVVDANAAGDAVLGWTTQAGPSPIDFALWFNTRHSAGHWSDARRWSEPGPGPVLGHSVAIDANRDAAALWARNISVRSATLVNGVVGPEELRAADAANVSLDAGPPGGPVAVALWRTMGAGAPRTLAASALSLGAGWSGPAPVPLRTAAELATIPPPGPAPFTGRIVALDTGARLAVWGTADDIRASRWTPGLGWGPAAVIAAPVLIGATPYLAAGPSGTAIATWVDSVDAGRTRIRASLFDGASWRPPVVVDARVGVVATGGLHPDLYGLDDAVVAWRHADTQNTEVRAAHFDGSSWTAESLVGTTPATEATDIALAVGPRPIVAWVEAAQAWISTRTAGAWSAPRAVTGPQRAVEEVVGFLDAGTLVLAWVERRADGVAELWGLTLDAPGIQISPHRLRHYLASWTM